MTYAEAKKEGYKPTYRAYQRGYVSRKINADEQEVITSPRGKKYVLLPAFNTTQYCIRQYIEKT